ncbi:oxidoreductase [Amycolatopsis orientalis]|uniref:oxidoreductase n=1 Tax=Amycolatopsis orientalis TaxID=31958 RepID=UPI00039B2DDA|nr:oxidoreductase [Amycolatopsis orientalis]
MSDVLVLGSTGTTGSRVLRGLHDAGVRAQAATRNPVKPGQIRFDWDDPATYGPALDGVSAVYLIAPVAADPQPLVEEFLQHAPDARVVLLSSSAVDEHTPVVGGLPGLVRRPPGWAVLRPSWFMQNFLPGHLVGDSARRGRIVTATGDARVAFADAGDIAAVAVRALLDPEPHNTDHLITGPRALNYAEAAEIVGEQLGHPVVHVPVSPEEYQRFLVRDGLPESYAGMLASLDEAIRGGAEDRVTDTVERVTGRPARDFRTFAKEEIR